MNSTKLQPHGAQNIEILTLLAQGLAPKEIAKEVGLPAVCVHARLARIRVKEGVQTNTGLVGKVLEARWANATKSKNREAMQRED